MALVEVEINNKLYQIGCEDEDKERLQFFAKSLNQRIEDFKKDDPVFFMGLNDERIFLFQALMLLEEVQGAKQLKLQPLQNQENQADLKKIKQEIDKACEITEQIKSLISQ